jgi:hypothetical protein
MIVVAADMAIAGDVSAFHELHGLEAHMDEAEDQRKKET